MGSVPKTIHVHHLKEYSMNISNLSLIHLFLKVHSFLQRITFNNTAGDEISLNEQGKLEAGFDIVNLITFPNNSYVRIHIGEMRPHNSLGKAFVINEKRIQWQSEFTQVY